MTALRRFAAPSLSPGLAVALWGACAAIVLAVVADLVLGDEDVAGYRVAFRLVGAAFVACGLIAWRRRPDSYSGLLMTATGFLLFVEPLAALSGSPEVRALGDLLQDLWSITIVWLLLTMLSGGRLVSTTERVLVGAFVVEFALTFASALFWERDGNFLRCSRSPRASWSGCCARDWRAAALPTCSASCRRCAAPSWRRRSRARWGTRT